MKFTSLKLESLRDLYLTELRDLYSAEKQLIEALPKMAEAATSPALKAAFRTHLQETEGHVSRLEQIFEAANEKPGGETCEAMKGLVEEGELYVDAKGSDEVRDAGLIAAAQKVEHYEIAGYGSARALAMRLGELEAANHLQETLDEEGAADHKLSEIAESQVNAEAAHA